MAERLSGPDDIKLSGERSESAATRGGRPVTNPTAHQGHVGAHDAAARRRPQRTSTEQPMIVSPTDMKPNVTKLSCQGCALKPAAVIGDRAAVPKIAAKVVTSQFP